MALNIVRFIKSFFNPEKKDAKGRVSVGWLIDAPSAGLIYDPPRRVKSAALCKHAKSASRCPAVLDLEARYFEIPCPFDLHLRIAKDKEGRWCIQNMADETSGIRPGRVQQQVHLINESEWRHPDRPMLQIGAPYRFVTDDVVYLTQCDPFMDYKARGWPGMVFGGRFPAHIWPRSLMWAFEWHDLTRPLVLKRGDPWFYVYFESETPDKKVRLVQAEMTQELTRYTRQIDGVTNYVNQTYSLFERAVQERPARLLTVREQR
ncbi:hypothetical protein [Aestuariispira insulae]|uniref:Uncharacterized protein n=1 Tax=Aestuariispira insulae TaxID=1461337 RepID=A0A3D9H1J7_9PROT|nr:hypothetical protein [Aestuariispira insulae]RED43383.1 hypothetical protein DFP90_1222 [Aestuariispira insulae]